MQTVDTVKEILADVNFPDYTFNTFVADGKLFIQASYVEADVVTGEPMMQKTRKWVVSPYSVKSEIVQTAFKCILTSFEHRVREHFTYKGERVYSPHFDVDALVEICKQNRFDERPDWYAEETEAKSIAV